ncbi:hypothetical protein ACFL3I_11705, partial [Pseudomonadota bacterium]
MTVIADQTTVANFSLDTGASISGKVTADAGGAELQDIEVCVTRRDGNWLNCTRTDSFGDYTVGGLPRESDLLVFVNDMSGQPFLQETWDNHPGHDWDNGDGVDVSSSDATGKDFALAAALRITGHVQDAVSGNNMPNVQLDVWDENYDYRGSAHTDENGNYEFLADGNGSYWLFVPPDGVDRPYLPQVWPGEYCNFNVCDVLATGDPVVVDGSDVGGIDFALDTGFLISGAVQDDGTTNPIQDAEVCIHRTDTQWTGVCVNTDVNGSYETYALPGGSDYVAYARGPTPDYQAQMWNSMNCPFNQCDFPSGTTIELGNPDDVAGIDFSLGIEASISGRVTSSVTGQGVNAQIRLHDAGDISPLGSVLSDDDGYYSISGIPAGSYYMLHNNRNGNLIDELYLDVPCPRLSCDPSAGTLVTLIEDEQLTGVDAELSPGSQITGTVTADGNPVFEYVYFYNSDESYAGFGWSDGNGVYVSRSGLPAGDYYVTNWSSADTSPYWAMVYPNVLCGDPCDLSLGALVAVNGTDDVGGIDFDLIDRNALIITGTVTADGSGVPLEGIRMTVSRKSDGARLRNAYTDAAGQYQFTLNEARDDLVVWTRTVAPQPYFPEVYQDRVCTAGFCDVDEILLGTSIDITTGSKIVNISLARSATVSGTLSSSVIDGPLGAFEGRARIYRQSDHVQSGIAFTDANGFYRVGGIEPGDYYLLLSGNSNNLIDELYDDANGIYCPQLSCDKSSARVFTVVGTEDVTNIDATLDAGTQFSGNVSENGVPLGNIFINFYAVTGELVGFGRTDGSGNYVTASGFPAGNYRAANRWMVNGVQQSAQNDQYIAMAYPDTPCGTPCDVTAGNTFAADGTPTIVPNIDFAFEDATASISGNITGSDTELAIENISLWLFDLECNYIDYAVTDSNGDYLVPVNVPGSFYLFAIANDALFINQQSNYMNQQYPDINMFDSCFPPFNDVTLGEIINVAQNEKVIGKDFVLEPGGTISGTISDSNGVMANGTANARLYDAVSGLQQVIALNLEGDDSYRLGGLLPGSYHVAFSSSGSGLIDERYDDVKCPRNSCAPEFGQVFNIVTGLEDFPGINAVLESGAVIRGRLSDAQSGLPVANYCAWIYNEAGVYATPACSDANGDFESSTGLPDGNYRLSNQLQNPTHQPVDGGYIPQVWTNDNTFLPCGAECDFTLGDTFTVNGTSPVEGIDLAMQKAIVTLSGTVTDHNGQPMPNVAVDVLDSEGSLVDSAAFTDSEGFWSKPVISYSTYYAKTIGEWAPAHQAEIWDDIPCDECDAVAVGTPIPVTDTDVGGVDFQLALLDVGSNLGFETGDLTSWILAGDGDKSVGAPGVGAQEGSYAARLTVPATKDVGNILQVFEASPGDEFYLSGYMLTESPQGAAFGILKIEFWDDSGNPLIAAYASKGFNDPDFPGINSQPVLDGNSPSNEWVFSEAQGVAPPGTTQVFAQLIYVNITDQEQSMWFDNIHMALVPSDTNTEVISGTVTADDGGAPLSGINVCVANKNDDQVDACAITDSLGKYLIGDLAPTNDYVVFTRDVGGQAFYREMYDSQSCCDVANGTSVDLSGGSAVIDFGLASSGRIAGFVKDVTTDLGIADVNMWLIDESCSRVDVIDTYTDNEVSIGQYSISGVPDGTYYVFAVAEYQGFINEIYPDEKRLNPCVGEYPLGQAIVIENRAQVEGIDFALDPGASISGFISDSNGVLDQGAGQMRLHDDSGELIGVYGNWNQDGSYSARGLLPGTYQVILSSRNLGLIDELYDDVPCPRFSCGPGLGNEVLVGPVEQVVGIDAVLEPGSTISGTLTDKSSGQPVPFFSIAFYTDSGPYAGFAFSDENGDYTSATGFPAGSYVASNQFNNDPVAGGYLPMVYPNRTCGEPCDYLLGDEIVLDGTNPETGIDFAMETGTTISGVVTTGGATPLANVTLQLRRSTDGAVIRSVMTDGSGAYQFAGVGSGTYFIRTLNTLGYADILHSGISCNPFCDPLAGTPINADGFSDITGISFNLPVTPAIAGIVKDELNVPVGGVKVQAYDVLGTLIASATSNGAGEYLVKNLYAGYFYVKTANTAGYVDGLWSGLPCQSGCDPTDGNLILVNSSGTTGGKDLVLGGPSTLSGTVSHSVGPLSGVTVQVYSVAGALVGSAITNAGGNYSVSGLGAGNYHAVTRNSFGYINEGAGGTVCQPATCAPTSTAVVTLGVNVTVVRDFVLDLGGVVSGTVANTAAAPLQSVTVRAYNASGIQVGSSTSGPSGNYSIIGLAGPVVYLRTTNALGYQNQRYNGLTCGATCNVLTGTAVAVSAGVTVTGKNFALALGGSISGVIRNTAVLPIANVQVQVLDAVSGVLAGYAVSGPAGAYTVAGLADGNYRLKTVNSSGYIDQVRGGDDCSPEPCALASGTVINVASANVTGVDMTLSLGGQISGVVTSAQEPPLPPIPLPLGTAWIYSDTGQLVKQGGIFSGSFFINGLANGIYHMVVTNGS